MSVIASDLWRMSATDLAAAIRSGQVSSQEVIRAHLRRIEDVNRQQHGRRESGHYRNAHVAPWHAGVQGWNAISWGPRC